MIACDERNWLLAEHVLRGSAGARDILSSLVSGEDPAELGRAWLEEQAKAETLNGSRARTLMAKLGLAGAA